MVNASNVEKEDILLGNAPIQEREAILIQFHGQHQGRDLLIHLRGAGIKREELQGNI